MLKSNFSDLLKIDDRLLFEDFVEGYSRLLKANQFKVSQSALMILPQLLQILESNRDLTALYVKTIIPSFGSLLFEKLADGKDRVRDLALASLATLIKMAYAAELTNPNIASVISSLEKSIVSIVNSKTPRAKESGLILIQTCSALVSQLHVKPFIPYMVKLLEDPNESVRNSSKEVLIELHRYIVLK
jgi:hypothetical protein